MRGEESAHHRHVCGPLICDDAETARPLRLQIFELVRATGPVSRSTVARDLGISPGTVSTLTADLIESGFLREATVARAPGDSARGRPPVALGVNPQAFVCAGVKLADRAHTGIVVDATGRQIASAHRPATPGQAGIDAQLDAMEALLDTMLGEAGLTRQALSAVGVGLPGVVDHASGRVFWSPVLDGRDLPFAEAATDRLGVDVTIDNDANLVALAELWFGIGRDKADFAVVTVEEGVGIGVVMNHRLLRGAHGAGLELGHTKVQIDGALCRCGQRGCLEAYIADYALAREAAIALGTLDAEAQPIQDLMRRLAAEAKGGNPAAASIFDRAGRYLAMGLANVVNLFDPALLILSGDRLRHDYLDTDSILTNMRDFTIDAGRDVPPLEIHEWGRLLWEHGAAALALSSVTRAALGAPREIAA